MQSLEHMLALEVLHRKQSGIEWNSDLMEDCGGQCRC